ncbi:MAG: hypothetical protein Q8R72_17660 [Hylemonella sp.]|nr:hypothetical protein [Hylemonella sp.]
MRIRRLLLRHVGKVQALVLLLWGLAALGALLGAWRPRPGWLAWGLSSLLGMILLAVWARWQREKYLREAPLPQFLKRKLRETYPHLSGKDVDLVERGLRQFFLACLRSRRKFVAMPSQVVDAMWHEFILHTRAYRDWCALSLGWFLHHTPALALGAQATNNDGLRRAWYWACRDEAIKPDAPSRLPLLFALDAKLGIANGFHYVPDCRDIARKSDAGSGSGGTYCGTSFSDGSYSGDADGFGGVDASSSDAGGSDGGGGCGGGGD